MTVVVPSLNIGRLMPDITLRPVEMSVTVIVPLSVSNATVIASDDNVIDLPVSVSVISPGNTLG